MRFGWLFAGLGLFALSTLVGAAAPLEINDAGWLRTFEVALDEVALSSPHSPRVVQTIAARSSTAELRQETKRRAAASGQTVEWVLYEVEDGVRRGDPCILTETVLFTVEPGPKAEALALRLGAVQVLPTALPDTWRAVAADAGAALDLTAALRGESSVRSADPMLARRFYPRLTPNDTRFTNQWHLNNTGQDGALPGVDIRVTNVWDTYRGAGQYIAIVDDGLQHTHPDLAAHSDTNLDYDLVYGDDDPNPELDPYPIDNALSKHGTACAGMAAAVGNNGMGVLGSAPEARLVGLRILLGYITDEMKAEAFSWSNQIIQIKSNSWGPGDSGYSISGPGPLAEAALSNACFSGRAGLGTLFFWAAGNGAENLDHANYDGYANSMYTIAIGALGPNGEAAWYSEPGANLVVCAPSQGSNTVGGTTGVWTTDRSGDYGYNDDGNGYPSWNFMSVRHWGEAAPGVWEVRIRDVYPEVAGVLTTLRLTLYGTEIALSNQPPAFASLLSPFTNSVGNPMVFPVYAPDLCDGDPVTLLASNLPAGATFPVTNDCGTFIWTNAAPTGHYAVTFHAFDKDGYAEARVEVGVCSPTATVVFLETVGTVGTSGDSIAAHQSLARFDNDHLTISGNGQVSDSSPSQSYPSASGLFYVRLVSLGDYFQVDGIDASGRSGLVVTYGVGKFMLTESGTNLVVEASTNGSIWTQLSPSTPWLPTGSGTAGWYIRTNALPPELAARDLRLRFRSAGGTAAWMLDDILLTGLKDVLDTDGDGLADDWEVQHFGGLLTADASSDWDGDQFSDRHEYRAGTEPTNAASLLKAGGLDRTSRRRLRGDVAERLQPVLPDRPVNQSRRGLHRICLQPARHLPDQHPYRYR